MAKVPKNYRAPIARYGPSVNKLARRKYGISGQQLLARLTQGESGFRMGAVSGAGARGATQFIPSTRAEYIKKFGIDPWRNPDQAEHATALYLKGAGNIAAYNPGDPGYTSYILGQKVSGLSSSGRQNASAAGPGGGAATKTIPGTSRLGERRALLLNYLQGNSGGDLLDTLTQIRQTQDIPARTVKVPKASTGGGKTPPAKGTIMVDGKPVAAWIAKRILRARKAGWQGSVESGVRTFADQKRIYNSGVRPAAKPGTSNHEFTAFPGGAVDVTDAAQLASVLKKLGIKKLQYAGAKDPVHFSHPHNGGY